MSGLKNTVKRVANVSMGRGYKTKAERQQEKKAKAKGVLDAQFANVAMPDEEELQLVERRRAARRRGSRAATVLTSGDTLG